MKKLNLCLLLSLILGNSLFSQVYMNLHDNIDIQSNSWVIFNPGNYVLTDAANDGIIRINNKENIIIEGPGVKVDGTGFTGYLVKIVNSRNIIIRNWDSVYHFKYAVHIMNADSIMIHNCDFSFNKVDSTGWIDVWANYASALGGGVMMYQVNHGDIHDNTMKMQNDGVALYHCNNIKVWNNDFDWNTSYGVRMFWTDSCYIHHNLASNINRPYTNPSDCAAILLIISNANLVEHNDFSHSGDGIFLGQYEYSTTPNNNVFLYNECSYSPHNAIEATFADGNIYKHNNCNYSHYGMWLGYSFNSLVDSNEIIGNQYSGIAVDRGFNNTITNNQINENPIGIELWEGGNISGYEDQWSHDYLVTGNTFDGNRLAVSSANTEHLVMRENDVRYNFNGIQVSGAVTDDTISSNSFRNTTFYHIDNQSTVNLFAPDNDYFATDSSFIACNIFDKSDNPSKGEVLWEPYTISGVPFFSWELKEDMAEEPAVWYAYPEICSWWDSTYATTVRFDSTDFLYGAASVFCGTGNGWDIGLEYHAAGDTLASWHFSPQDTMIFWVKTNNMNDNKFQYHSIWLGNDCGGYFKYAGSAVNLSNAQGVWKQFRIPLAGGGTPYYVRSQVGQVSLDEITYFSLHADTWGVGFELWLDGLHFAPLYTMNSEPASGSFKTVLYPNPVTTSATLSWCTGAQEKTSIAVLDYAGKPTSLHWEMISRKGENTLEVPVADLSDGLYLVRISSGSGSAVCKMIVLK